MVIPRAAVREIQRKPAEDPAVRALATANWMATVDPGPIPPDLQAFGLGEGETAVLAHALANPGSGVILADQAARTAASALGLSCQGTLAVVLFAKTAGLVPAARPIVEELRRNGMYLSERVMDSALAKVGE